MAHTMTHTIIKSAVLLALLQTAHSFTPIFPSLRNRLSATATATAPPEIDKLSVSEEILYDFLHHAKNAMVRAARHLQEEADRLSRVAPTKVVVAGATGKTGRKVLERLTSAGNLNVIGGVRCIKRAVPKLSKSSTVIRGFRVEKVKPVDISSVTLQRLDVAKDSIDDLVNGLGGAHSLVIAIGFVTHQYTLGNPFKMKTAAYTVDNIGTCKLIDAAKKVGVKKIVMASSILTNGRSWGQENAPVFFVTNALGCVLDQKLVAENYLKSSGIDYTIVRASSLKAEPPKGALKICREDTLNDGEVSRDLVADVCFSSLTDPKCSNKVLELTEINTRE